MNDIDVLPRHIIFFCCIVIELYCYHSYSTVKDHSGSEPDIRKTSRDPRSISPTDSHEAYKIIQKGGEIPLSGLRLPAPEKTEKSQKGKRIPVLLWIYSTF